MNRVDKFLKHFHSSQNINDVFTSKCCYWFAFVLFGRFIREGAVIMYDKTANHFGTKIHNKVYDITGDVTDNYHWKDWDSIDNESVRQQVLKDYIMF